MFCRDIAELMGKPGPWQEKYVPLKAYWSSGTSEFSPISANLQNAALYAIFLKLYIHDDVLILLLLAPALVMYNVVKLFLGWWRDHAMLWHYEANFTNERNPALCRIEKAVVKSE